MPLEKIKFPDFCMAIEQIPVRITDINYGNHVGNDAFVCILHEARVLWLKKHHFSEMDVGGAGLIMSNLHIQFKNESFYGDIMEIKIACGEITRVSFDLLYEISTKRNGEYKLLALATTQMICYNYENKKVVSLPAQLKHILEQKT